MNGSDVVGCPFCGDSGFVYLLRWVVREQVCLNLGKLRWLEQVLAPCKACPLGEQKQRKVPHIEYHMQDIDVSLRPDEVAKLGPARREQYEIVAAGRKQLYIERWAAANESLNADGDGVTVGLGPSTMVDEGPAAQIHANDND